MNWNDRPNFAAKMLEVATLLGVVVDEEDVGAFFRHLEDYPYDVVCAAIDRAIKDRDPSDEFLRRAMLTLPEIMGAIDNIVKETST
ncbi:MAG: hypothetical protein GTO41_08665, partial [Burkholderiales bacterium]|nr:hypothetical protein [Burkholderiales bacterium]